MKEENKKIGQAVKKLIIDSGISQTEIANRLEINKSSLSQMLSGVAPLPFERFRKIVDMIHAPADEIERIRLLYMKRETLKLSDTPEGAERLMDAARQEINRQLPVESRGIPPKTTDAIRNTPELRECIKDAMMKTGITSASELNRLIGYDSTNTLERLLTGKLNWFPDILSAVLDNLCISHDDAPMSPGERMLLTPEGIYRQGALLIRPIPVVDWANAADYIGGLMSGNAAVMEKWDPDNTEIIPAPVGVRKGAVSFRVHGQSMEPKILDGDKLVCEPAGCLEDIPSNKVVVVQFAEDYEECPGCVVCKRLRRIAGAICLTSDNQVGRIFEDIQPRDITWVGIVVAKYTDDL